VIIRRSVPPLTVVCLLVKGHVAFTPLYVERLATMVRRHVDRPVRIVCLTDQPNEMPAGVEPIAVERPYKCKAWWSKCEVWNAKHGWKGRMLYLDLDVLIVKSLRHIIDYPASFALIPHSGNFHGAEGLAVVKRFNSSVMVWDAGTQNHLYEAWSRDVTRRLWGDQDWVGERAHDAAVMPREWFPRISEVPQGPPFGDAKVILVKTPKNTEAERRYEWFGPLWSAA
jgi:hypothetical protein